MENFRFILEPYNRHQRNRYTCPSCGKHREFTRYIDTQGAISFPEYVGKCNRINNCGYHYTPAMYFDEHPECKEYNKSFPIVKDKKPVVCHPRLPPAHRHTDTSFIPDEIMQQTMKCYEQNNLFLYLANHLGYESALRLMKTYHVGTAKKWKNATVFWQTDISGKIRTGKIMQYNAETGKRIKEPYADNENKMFIIRDVIGCGGFALTYKAIEVGSNYDRTVAVKEFFVASMQTRVNSEVESVLSSNLENLFRAKTKFRSEAEKIRQLANCHNIIDVYDVFDKNGTSYYTMEYIDGCDLRYYCESCEEGYLNENEALNIISELCKAVKAMHNINMNHLDIKPDNIMIENNTGRIILIDFGTATRIADNEHTFILDCVSNGYTPIENSTIQDFCPQKDIYSIGATLYFLLTGCDPPSSSELVRKWDNWNKLDGISEKAWQIIESAMQPDFRNRPSNIEALEMIIG